MMTAISKGVYNAIWDIATNATHAPCGDFYASIEKGVKDAHLTLGRYDDDDEDE